MAQSRRKGRQGAALLASAAVHGVVLLLLARAVPVLPSVQTEPPFQIELVPMSESPVVTPSHRPERNTSTAAPLVSESRPSLTRQQTPSRRRLVEQPAPTRPPLPRDSALPRPAPARPSAQGRTPPPAARPAAPPSTPAQNAAPSSVQSTPSLGGAANARRGPASLPGAVPAGGVNQFLRQTVGCSHQDFVHLTVAERAECERQNGVQASIGGRQRLDALPAGRRGYFDSVQQAYQRLHRYETPLDTGAGGQGAAAPGHGPSYGCIHGKCGMISPEGVLTEESGSDPH